jgi:alanine racemase
MTEAESLARWLEIDLDAVAHNISLVKGILGDQVHLMAVVKSDAYGHGLVPVAQIALECGASMLGVTHPEEGIMLREAGITAPVLIFRPLFPGEEDDVVSFGLTPSVSSLEQAERLAAAGRRAGKTVKVHLKLETGMGRTGFLPDTLLSVAGEIFALRELEWEGIYTHFAAAGDSSFTKQQFRIFDDVVSKLAAGGITFLLRHVCNSAAALLYPAMRLEMVRIGTLLYGQLPAGIKDESLDLRDTWSFWTRVLHLHRVRRGETVGYGRTYRARQDTTLAVVPVGYSDGFGIDVNPRPAGLLDLTKVVGKIILGYFGFPVGAHYVSINGASAPVVGRIGMELSCIDVGKIPDVTIGTPVLLQARRTVIRASIPRVYRQEMCQQLF